MCKCWRAKKQTSMSQAVKKMLKLNEIQGNVNPNETKSYIHHSN